MSRVVTIAEACSLVTDGTHYTPIAINTGYPFLTVKDVSDAGLDFEDCARISEEDFLAADSGNSAPKYGDVLFSKDGTVGKVHVVKTHEDFAVLSSLAILRPKPDVDPDYLGNVLKLPKVLEEALKKKTGSAIRRIILSDLKQVRIPLPSLPVQRRIAAILDKADSVRAKRRETLVQLDRLAQSIFVEMFGDIATNPKKWPEHRIDVITDCLDRHRKPVTESERKPGEIPYYGANGQQGWINDYLFDEPLVLVAEDGGHFENPMRGVAYRIDGKSWVNNHAHILRPKQEFLEIEYLHRALKHFNFLPYISGTTRAKLTQGQLNSVKLMTPPVSLQIEFSKRIENIGRIEMSLNNSLGKMNTLISSIQSKAFEGKL